MALNLDTKLLTSVLSNYHTFIPKLELIDKARIKQIETPDPVAIPFEDTYYTLDEVEKKAKFIFDSITYNNTTFIFTFPQLPNGAVYNRGPLPNEMYYVEKKGTVISEVKNTNLVFKGEHIRSHEMYYNAVCGQFGIVYTTYMNEGGNTVLKTFLKRLIIETETGTGNYIIKEYDETFLFNDSDFLTATCLDNGNLIIISKKNKDISKSYYKFNVSVPEISDVDGKIKKDILETETVTTKGKLLNLQSENVGDKFYYLETVDYQGKKQTNIYDDYVFGYTPFISDNEYNDFCYTGNGFTLTSTGSGQRYTLFKTNMSFDIIEQVPMNGTSSIPTINAFNYAIFNGYCLFNDNGLYIQDTNYKVTYREEDTVIEIPANRIMKVDFESISDNLKPRVLNISLNNDDGFFTEYGRDESGFDYKNYFNTTRVSLRQIKYYIGDKDAVNDDGSVIYECLYTGYLNTPEDLGRGILNISCSDGLDIMKKAIHRPKTYSMIKGEDYINDLMKQAGFDNVVYEFPLNYTIKKIELDRRQNVLDSVKKILDVCNATMYFDRFGVPIITQRIMYKENIFNIYDKHIVGIPSIQEPSIEYTRNIVRIITDNERDVYSEARDEEAITNMGYESPMELDYTGLFEKPDAEKVEYSSPTNEEISNVLSKLYPTLATDPTALMFCEASCGRFGWHSRYLYAVIIKTFDSPDVYLVSSENELYFKQVQDQVIAYQTNNSVSTGINVYGKNTWNHGYLNRTDAYVPINGNPLYGCRITSRDENHTLIRTDRIYPSKEYFPDKKYEEFPDRVYKNFKKELIRHFEVNCGITLTDIDKEHIIDFVALYSKPEYELFYYAKSGASYQPGIFNQTILPCYFWDIVAVKKDYTYFDEIPERMTHGVKGRNGRYSKIISKDNVSKYYLSIRHYYTEEEGAKEFKLLPSYNLDDDNDYGLRDFGWHKETNEIRNGVSSQNLANRILKQVCRTTEYDTVKTVPLFFLTPEDIVYLNTTKIKGYRKIKSIKHNFNFSNTRSLLYECSVKLQDAIENVDFILLNGKEK